MSNRARYYYAESPGKVKTFTFLVYAPREGSPGVVRRYFPHLLITLAFGAIVYGLLALILPSTVFGAAFKFLVVSATIGLAFVGYWGNRLQLRQILAKSRKKELPADDHPPGESIAVDWRSWTVEKERDREEAEADDSEEAAGDDETADEEDAGWEKDIDWGDEDDDEEESEEGEIEEEEEKEAEWEKEIDWDAETEDEEAADWGEAVSLENIGQSESTDDGEETTFFIRSYYGDACRRGGPAVAERRAVRRG